MGTKALLVAEFLTGYRHPTTDAPLAGGLVYFYEAGTTTNKAVWTDNAKTAAHNQPVTLDSSGRALVYAEGLYRVVVKDSAGVTLVTWDPWKAQYVTANVVTKTAAYTATSDDDWVLVDTSGGNVTITLPAASGSLSEINVKKISSDGNSVIVAAGSGDLVDGAASVSFSTQNQTQSVVSDGTSNWYGAAATNDALTLGGFSPAQTPGVDKVVVAESDGKINGGWIDWTNDIPASVAGNGLGKSSEVLSVNVDGTTIEINADTLRILPSWYQYAAGSDYYLWNRSLFPISSFPPSVTTYTKLVEVKMPFGGAVRTEFKLASSSGGTTVWARIYVNGSAVGTEHLTNAASPVQFSDASISLNKGDLLQIYAKGFGSAGPIVTDFVATATNYIARIGHVTVFTSAGSPTVHFV